MKWRIPMQKSQPKKLPVNSKAAKLIREHIAEFAKEYPKTAFFKLSKHYKNKSKYFQPEELLQMAFFCFIQHYYKQIGFHHSKNESKEGYVGQAKKKLMGVKDGVADCMLQLKGVKGKPLCWIELKVGYNKPTESQLTFLNDQEKMGHFTAVCYDLYECRDMVETWLSTAD